MNEEALIEQLADKEHASWARWMKYLFQVCELRDDGCVIIPPELVKRWMRQMDTPYECLPEWEKQSDRDEVAHILPIIRKEEGMLQGGDMLWLRRMVREEIAQGVERFFARGLDNLMTAIKEPRNEEEELAAVLATLSSAEFEAVIARVRESKQP